MAPIKPFWTKPSHPNIEEVIYGEDENGFTTESISKISLPPFGLFAKLEFPPCTIVEKPSYSTVQIGKDKHIDLNSDLLYLNHSCEPSLILNPQTLTLTATSRGLSPTQPLTFFYPSTEYLLSQPFSCNCRTPSCLGTITGAGDMSPETIARLKTMELGEHGFGKGAFFSAHILEMLEERVNEHGAQKGNGKMNGHANGHANGNGGAETAGAGGRRCENSCTKRRH
ncbi:hypothetical protein ACMFMG_006325 [Clarireedia jacksonii]